MMWGFKLGFGTCLSILFSIIYILCILVFPLCKRNDIFGLRHEKCFESEKIWHKIHLIASFVTIPYAILSIVTLFLCSEILKIIISFVILILVITSWHFVIQCTERNYFEEKKQKEQKELIEQEKRETGWR